MFLGARVTRAEDLDENEKKMSIFVWSRFGIKYQLDILDFFRASENIVYFGDGSPAEMSPKSYFWKKAEKTVFVTQISFVEPCWKGLLFSIVKENGYCGDFCTNIS